MYPSRAARYGASGSSTTRAILAACLIALAMFAAVFPGVGEGAEGDAGRGSGWWLHDRVHDLSAHPGAEGLRLFEHGSVAGSQELGLRVVGLQRGTRPLSGVLAHPMVRDGDGRLEVLHAGFTEWYVNSEQGLEHGFDLPVRPAGEGLLRLWLAVTSARAALEGDRIVFETRGGRRLEYGHLAVVDARGEALPARFEVASLDRLALVVDDRRASYPPSPSTPCSPTHPGATTARRWAAAWGWWWPRPVT